MAAVKTVAVIRPRQSFALRTCTRPTFIPALRPVYWSSGQRCVAALAAGRQQQGPAPHHGLAHTPLDQSEDEHASRQVRGGCVGADKSTPGCPSNQMRCCLDPLTSPQIALLALGAVALLSIKWMIATGAVALVVPGLLLAVPIAGQGLRNLLAEGVSMATSWSTWMQLHNQSGGKVNGHGSYHHHHHSNNTPQPHASPAFAQHQTQQQRHCSQTRTGSHYPEAGHYAHAAAQAQSRAVSHHTAAQTAGPVPPHAVPQGCHPAAFQQPHTPTSPLQPQQWQQQQQHNAGYYHPAAAQKQPQHPATAQQRLSCAQAPPPPQQYAQQQRSPPRGEQQPPRPQHLVRSSSGAPLGCPHAGASDGRVDSELDWPAGEAPHHHVSHHQGGSGSNSGGSSRAIRKAPADSGSPPPSPPATKVTSSVASLDELDGTAALGQLCAGSGSSTLTHVACERLSHAATANIESSTGRRRAPRSASPSPSAEPGRPTGAAATGRAAAARPLSVPLASPSIA
jgi:hypothetical protein